MFEAYRSAFTLLDEGRSHILLNLGDVDYIDSSGIGQLVAGFTTVANQGGQLKLLNLSKRIKEMLQITKVSSNIWWNASRDSFSTGLGMLVQAVGSPDMAEGAAAFMAKRKPAFPPPA